MSYTTRCPACGTTFRVVPDQLKISDGWVRCGHCADVFDARLYLEQWTPAPHVDQGAEARDGAHVPDTAGTEAVSEPVPVGDDFAPDAAAWTGADASFAASDSASVEASEALADTTGGWSSGATPPARRDASDGALLDEGQAQPADPLTPGHDGLHAQGPDASGSAWTDWDASSGPGALEADGPVPQAAAPVPTGDDFHAELARFAATTARAAPTQPLQTPSNTRPAAPGFSEPDQVAERQAAIDARDASAGEVEDPDASDDVNDGDEPSFMRQARRQAFWRAPGVRAALVLAALLLSALLAAQWTVHERDRLAASHPSLAPWLKRLCAPLGCTVSPLRHIDAVVIDSSTLARRLGNYYAFDVVIKNNATLPVALPALELSLTDTRDQVIARRVFLQQDMPGAPALLPAQGSVPLSLRLSITDVGPVPMAGYRALVFYP